MHKLKFMDVAGLAALLLLLAAVRFFQHRLFYDPLEAYFHADFQALSLPSINLIWLTVSNAFRYALNTALSVTMLWILFKDRSYLQASLWVYLFAFLILNFLFFAALQFETELSKMALFYTRRFLIHPLLLFVLIAGGYFLRFKNGTITTSSSAPADEK